MQEKIKKLERFLHLPDNTLDKDMDLLGLGNWDSMTVMNFIVEFSTPVNNISLKDINDCETVGDLCNLL